jgi:hypothetical protein
LLMYSKPFCSEINIKETVSCPPGLFFHETLI